MDIRFTKMHGLGNDFVVIDAVSQQIEISSGLVRRWADRHFGIGFDQLLLVENPQSVTADFKYRIFNADGSEVSQCGNGARCFARFVSQKKLTSKREIRVDTNAGQLLLTLTDNDWVTVNMGEPKFLPQQIPLGVTELRSVYSLVLEGQEVEFSALSMGNPHAVLRVEDVANAPVNTLGAAIESHSIFPERVNVGFMQVVSRHQIRLRVYERGAAETLACGSGACAAVVAGIERGWLDAEVVVDLPGGQLNIGWQGEGAPVLMSGPAEFVYEGVVSNHE